jgi:hypothetical protein
MSTFAVQPTLPLAGDGDAMAEALRHAGVKRDQTIWVTGPAGLTALIWLNGKRYRGASYAHLNRIAAMAPADALIIPHACSPAEVADLLRGAKCLRKGGALIVQLKGALSADALGDAPALLAPLGYQVERRLYEKGRTVCIARRVDRPEVSVAA